MILPWSPRSLTDTQRLLLLKFLNLEVLLAMLTMLVAKFSVAQNYERILKQLLRIYRQIYRNVR